MSPSVRSLCDPLGEDAELAEAIDSVRRPAAIAALAPRELVIPEGTWSSAVSELSRAGLVRSVREGWLLAGEPSGEPDGSARSAGEIVPVATG